MTDTNDDPLLSSYSILALKPLVSVEPWSSKAKSLEKVKSSPSGSR